MMLYKADLDRVCLELAQQVGQCLTQGKRHMLASFCSCSRRLCPASNFSVNDTKGVRNISRLDIWVSSVFPARTLRKD